MSTVEPENIAADLEGKCYDCTGLPGARQQQICQGGAGLSPLKRAKYLAMWAEKGLISEIPCDSPDRPVSRQWTPADVSRGLGDTIAKLTSWLGFTPCTGCKERQDALNAMIPFKSAAETVIKRPTQAELRGSRSSVGSAFKMGSAPPRFISAAQLQEDTKRLISKIPSDITAIAGVARSGLSVATMISMYLHLPLITIRQSLHDVIEAGNGWRLGGNQHVDRKQGRILVVDDTVMTGNSIKVLRPLVQQQLGNHLFATVYANPAATEKPDIYAVSLPWPHILEWNMFNSVLSPSIAMDFDGVICLDCPPGSDDDGPKYLEFIRNAKPLYLPRRLPVPLIVTARIERYRAETEAWLARHGVACQRLEMHPAKTLGERNRDDIAAYKARHFLNWAKEPRPRLRPLIFIESDDRQAKEIGRRVSNRERIVVCPASGKVY